tara:strand:+ start:119 stop:220 length:102 start_codon:yes stop_codon:yes gene_type:complete
LLVVAELGLKDMDLAAVLEVLEVQQIYQTQDLL